ncbi:MAG: MipA/OmpV family protein [Magnetospirillum sp.]|jgi:outer membrane scaffolding protein for murein synthesis (MipA/OmpV family)|nr:MipA/OmpV family protein [Magnetospirillum sp.]
MFSRLTRLSFASLAFASLGLAAALSGAAVAQTRPEPPKGDWQVTTGALVGYAPAYEGADKYKVMPLPLIDVVWRDRVFLSTMNGLGAWAYRADGFSIGGAIGYEFGRDESLDRSELDGLGDVDAAAQARLLAEYRTGPFRLDAALARALGGSDGTTLRIGASMGYPINDKLRLMPGIAAVWADENYMDAYFGVTAAQSALSRARLGTAAGKSQFEAKSGVKNVDLSLMASYSLTQNWMLRGGGGVRFLVGDAADSPISKRDTAPFVNLGLAYRW